MNIIQCCLQGAKHKKLGLPCQDRTYSLTQNGVTVIALADGAGNEKYTHSADGAECVCDTAVDFFCNNFDKFYEEEDTENLKTVLKTVCQRALQKRADELGVDDIIKLSSTMLVCAVKDDKVIVCHIGDGVIGMTTPEGAMVVSAPDNGEFASSTFFITNPYAEKKISISRFERGNATAFFMMSDGISEYVFDDAEGQMRETADKLASLATQKNGEQTLMRVIKNYVIDKYPNSDDCSYIILSFEDENDNTESFDETLRENDSFYELSYSEDEPEVQGLMAPLSVDSDKKAENFEDDDGESEKSERNLRTAVIIALVLVIAMGISIISAVVFLEKKDKKTVEKSITASTISRNDNHYESTQATSAVSTTRFSGGYTQSITVPTDNSENASSSSSETSSNIQNGKPGLPYGENSTQGEPVG